MPEPAERTPFLLRAGEGESVWSLGGRFTAKATAAVTEGRFALVESVAFRSTEPPLHIHHREDEAWYIVDGKMTFYVGDAVIEATAGCFAFAPRDWRSRAPTNLPNRRGQSGDRFSLVLLTQIC